MGRHAAVEFLAMLELCTRTLGIDILPDRTVQSDGQNLYATADAQDGNLTVKGQTCQLHFTGITAWIDPTQSGDGLFAYTKWIDVGSARQDDAVEAVKQTAKRIPIGIGRDNNGSGTRFQNRAVIAFCQFASFVSKVACNTNQRNRLISRERSVAGIIR